MISIIVRWFLNALALYIVAMVLPGIHLLDFGSALIAVVVIGLVNALIKPLLFLLTLPVTIITFGLFALVLNALMLMLASALTPGFKIDGFGTALLGSILLSIVTTVLHTLVQ